MARYRGGHSQDRGEARIAAPARRGAAAVDSGLRVRAVEARDRDAWLRMRLALFPDSTAAEVDEWLAASRPEGTRAVGEAVLVAERAGRLLGFAELGRRDYAEGCVSSPVAYVEAWWVEPDARRAGVGRALVSAAERWALARGLTELASDTTLDNATSIAAHAALGFAEVERQVCFRKTLR